MTLGDSRLCSTVFPVSLIIAQTSLKDQKHTEMPGEGRVTGPLCPLLLILRYLPWGEEITVHFDWILW